MARTTSLAPFLALLLAFATFTTLGLVRPQTVGAVTIECTTAATPPAATPATFAAAVASPVAFPAGGGTLTVFAGLAQTAPFDQIKADLEAAYPGLTITYNYGRSVDQVTQLTEGAQADVFVSPAIAPAIEAGVLAGEPAVFAQTSLGIIVPKDNPAGVQSPADLAKPGLKLVLASTEVVVGRLTRQSICKMGQDPATYGEGFVEKVGANVVSEEATTPAVVEKVQGGEADAAIVYMSNVTADLVPIEIPAEVNETATFHIAAVEGGQAELAQAFIGYVLGPDGQATFQKFGYETKP